MSWKTIRTAHHSVVPSGYRYPYKHPGWPVGVGCVGGAGTARAARPGGSSRAFAGPPGVLPWRAGSAWQKNPPGRYHPGAPRSQLKVSWHDEGRFTYTEGRRHDTAHAGQAEAALRPQPRPKLRRVRCLSRRLPSEQETTSQPPKRAKKKHPHQTD